MLSPTQHRFSVKDYYRMAETGALPLDARLELLNGEIIDLSPIGPFHGGLVKRLNRIFNLRAKGRWIVSTQDPVHLDNHNLADLAIEVYREPNFSSYSAKTILGAGDNATPQMFPDMQVNMTDLLTR